jgi:carbonic anhydrase
MKRLIGGALTAVIALVTLPGAAMSAEPGQSPKYSYQGATGPEHWGDLDPAFKTCRDGKAQSPIDVIDAQYSPSAKLKFEYNRGRLDFLDHDDSEVSNGHGNAIVISGKTYKLYNVHFHHLSEHTIAGKSFAMEAHLVHKADDGTLAVIGVMVVQGSADRGSPDCPTKTIQAAWMPRRRLSCQARESSIDTTGRSRRLRAAKA